MAIDSAAADFSQTPARSDFVILPEWQVDKLHELKAAKPTLKVLMYKNLSAMMPSVGGEAGTGVTTQEAETHPEWFLLNTGGQRFTFSGFDYLWASDIGNRSYQDRWAANVAADLRADQWDGVFIDDANPTMRYHYDLERVARYPSDAAYSAATGSALAVIGPLLRSQGKLVIPNFGDWRNYLTTVGKWLPYVSGGMEEHFTKWGEDPAIGYLTGWDWESQLAALKQTQAAGKYHLNVSHSGAHDAAAARYGWATTLLAARGKASFTLAENYTDETWFPEYDYNLGNASGNESKLAGGVHRRAFERGIVLVNPTLSSVSVSFGGRYHGSGASSSSSTVMGPHTGLILLADGVPAPAAPTAGAASSTPAALRASAAPNALGVGGAGISALSRPARSTLRVRVTCQTAARPCRRMVTAVLRGTGHRVVVGRRRVRIRRTVHVAVRLNATGRSALERGGRISGVVRALR